MENKKVKISLTIIGEMIFSYLTDRECYGIKQVAETIKIFPNYKIAELQYWSGLSERDFMKALYWLYQYEFVQSWNGNLGEIIPKELAKMGCEA